MPRSNPPGRKKRRPLVRWVEYWLRSVRLRIIILTAGLFLLVVLWLLRNPGNGTSAPDTSEPDVDITVIEPSPSVNEPLVAPFYPTFENVGTLTNLDDMERYLYAFDETAYVFEEDLDIENFLAMDFRTDLRGGAEKEPKILIFHTHSQESFIDSRPDERDDTIVGVGTELARILSKEYGISVVHDVGQYDVLDGAVNREGSYERMEPAVLALLEKYPSIEVTIDLHRDGVPDSVHLLTTIDGQPTARIMFFNGMSRLRQMDEPVELDYLPNPYLKENLALSLQMQLTANTYYPGITRRIYIRPYRYSLHFTPKSMLVEVGANTNTVEEVYNAMQPLAEIINRVLNRPEEELEVFD